MSPSTLEPGRPWRALRNLRWPALGRSRSTHHVLVQPEGVCRLGAASLGSSSDPSADKSSSHTADLPLWLAAHPGCRVHVVLSGRLVHPLLVRQEALVNASHNDQLAWARQQWAHFHGPEAAAWPVALWCQAPVLAALALHGADLAAWQAAAGESGCDILSVQPWWAHLPDYAIATSQHPTWPGLGVAGLLAVEALPAGAQAGAQGGQLGDQQGGAHATWMGFEQGRLAVLEQRRADGPAQQGLLALVQEWQQAHGTPAPATLIMAFGLHADTSQRLAQHGCVLGLPTAAVPPLPWVAP